MKRHIDLQFALESSSDDGNIAKFKAIASESGVMTTHNMVFASGAFRKAIKNLKQDKKHLVMCFNHDLNEIIGGFPTDSISERKGQLSMNGEINLDVQRGGEIFSLIKQEVLTDLSVGIEVDPEKGLSFNDDLNCLEITNVDQLFETSVVWSGANPAAKITALFGTLPFQDFPIAPGNPTWDGRKAVLEIRKFTNSEESPSAAYRKGFMWFDSSKPDNFGSYKLAFVNIIDGKMMVIPKAISDKVGLINGARGGLDIPEADLPALKRNVNRYLVKMGKEKAFSDAKQIHEFTIRDCENFLKSGANLSDTESKQFLSIVKSSRRDAVSKNEDTIERDVLFNLLIHNLLIYNLLTKIRNLKK